MIVRLSVFLGALAAGCLWVAMLTYLLPAAPPELPPDAQKSIAADLLLDRNTKTFTYPFTIQNLMWIVFFVGVGEICVRYFTSKKEAAQLGKRLLPEDEQTILRKEDVGEFYRGIRETDPNNKFWLQRLLSRGILAFQSTGSIEQVSTVFNSALELCQHEVDLRYNLLKYLVWLIPTLGFVGTVVGIAFALEGASDTFADFKQQGSDADLAELGPLLMENLTGALGVAFYTTLLALLQSAVLMFAIHLIQGREENALNRVGQYCLDNLINRLYEKR